MLGPMEAACTWAQEHGDELLDAHEGYEAAAGGKQAG